MFPTTHSIFIECVFEYRDEPYEHKYQIPVKIAKKTKEPAHRVTDASKQQPATRRHVNLSSSLVQFHPSDIPIYGKTCRVRNVLYRRRSFRLLTFYVFKSVPQSLPGEKRDFCRVHGASRIFIKIALEHEYVHTLRNDGI